MEPYPQFSLDVALPACRVTKAALIDLESNISATLTDIVREEKGPPATVQLSIKDASGEELLTSAQMLGGTLFSDSTSEVQLQVTAKSAGSTEKPVSVATVRLRFRENSRPSLRIILQCSRARDHAVGLKDRVLRVLSESFDTARFFRPARSFLELLTGMAMLGALIWVAVVWDTFSKSRWNELYTSTFWFWSSLLVSSWAYPLICVRYFPLCMFESKRRLELDEQRSWARKAVWSLIASNLVAAFLGAAAGTSMAALMPWNQN